MDTLGVIALAAASGLLVAWGFTNRQRVLEFPFFIGVVMVGWVLPQCIGLLNDPFLPEGALLQTSVFGALCALSVLAGYRAGSKPFNGLDGRLDNELLFVVAIVLMVAGGIFFVLVRVGSASATEEYSGQWSGTITIYYFFSRLLGYGLILAVVGFLQQPSKGWFFLILVGAVFYADRIITFGRRSELIELIIIAALMLWFQRRYVISRWVVAVAATGLILVVNGVGNYRSYVGVAGGTEWGELGDIDFVASFAEVLETGGEELRNAAYTISATARSLNFDWGLSAWNALVSQYVPAQLIGDQEKARLLIPLADNAYREYGHVAYTGSTPTGLSDAFVSFGYFGFIKFFLVAYVIGRLWNTANRGQQAAQILLLVLLTPAIQTITHSTNWLLKDVPQVIICLLLPLYYARSGLSQRLGQEAAREGQPRAGRL